MKLDPSDQETAEHGLRRWVSWLLGIAVLMAVVVIGTHFSEERAFIQLARDAKPSWIVVAFLLQASTYLAQGQIWRTIARMAGSDLSVPFVYKLSLTKLFVDQALPSAGISGSIVVAHVLERTALPRAAVLAGVVVNTTSFFIAYVAALVSGLVILVHAGRANSVIVLGSTLFMLLSTLLAGGMLALSGKDVTRGRHWLARYRLVRTALAIMKEADPDLVCNAKVQAVTSSCQLITFLLDAATLLALVRSLGATVGVGAAFASFMIANLVQTLSFIPAGLGTFEAAAVLMLRTGGVPVAIALSTALLFRGLTFFLPMLPGLWFSRHLTRQAPSRSPAS